MHDTIDSTRILTRSEIATVLADLRRKRRSINTRQNAVIFRLSCCAGLRVSEIAGLSLDNVKLSAVKPYIYIPAAIAKRGKSRRVALWWDASTLATIQAWKAERAGQGASGSDPYVCSQAHSTLGKRLSIRNVQNRWKHAIKSLGRDRALSIHCGRHSFCSHSLAGGRTLLDVRDAAGHSSVATTSIYLHSVTEDDGAVGSIFEFTS
jgi:integrase/recombinase XerC